MGSEIVNEQDNSKLKSTIEQNGKSGKKNGVYNFFIADENQEINKTSTKEEKKHNQKGALDNEQSVNFFLPEWF